MNPGLIALKKRATSGGSFVLDGLSVASVAAYSLRQLRTLYSGPLINVRRSSDNTTQDIGAVSGVLDTASLLAFCGSGDGFIAAWYDQTGNTRTGTQATASSQPKIVSAGTVLLQNGKPTLAFYNGAISFLSATINAFSTGYAMNAVVVNTGTQAYACIADKSTSSGIAAPWMLFAESGIWNAWFIGNGSGQYHASTTPASNIFSVITHQVLGSTVAGQLFANGTQNVSTTFSTTYGDTTNPVTIGMRGDAATYLQGNLSELIFFAAPLSDVDRHLLERNQGTFFGISVT